MNRLRWLIAIMSVCGLALAACAPTQTDGLRGRLLLWHDLETDADTLEGIIADFEDIYPGVEVVIEVIPENVMQTRYQSVAELGLGPDLFIGSSRWITPLADAGLLQDISSDSPALDRYLTTALQNVRYDGGLYGLPFSLSPAALYYNVETIQSPPETLSELLSLGSDGTTIGLLTRFDGGFWGVAALGGQLFDADGRVVLDQGGFTSWLDWLQNAQDAPGLTLSRDQEALRELFVAGELDAYVGKPDDLPVVQQALGTTGFAVIPLPGGQGGTAGPLLDVDALLFNPATSDNTRQAALALAQFLTNDEQSNTLVRTRNIVPANRNIQPNARLYPGISGFVTQSRAAIAIPNTLAMDAVLEQGDILYQQVFAGVMTSEEAASILTEQVNDAAGFAPVATTVEDCTLDGTLEVWHSWDSNDLSALEAIVADYGEYCPDVAIDLVRLPTHNTVVRGFESVAGSEAEPNALLIPSSSIYTLASADLLQIITLASAEQYTPVALESLRYP